MRSKEKLPPLQKQDVYLVDDKNDTIRLRSMFPDTESQWWSCGLPGNLYNAPLAAYYFCSVTAIIDDIDDFLSRNFVYYNIGNGFRELDMRVGDNQKFVPKFNKKLKVAARRAQKAGDSRFIPYYAEYLHRTGALKDE